MTEETRFAAGEIQDEASPVSSEAEAVSQPAASAPEAAESASDASSGRELFPKPPATPVIEGPEGVRFDFNDGCRLFLPPSETPWKARLLDTDTGNVIFETSVNSGRVNSSKRYFVRFRIEIVRGEETVFTHDYDAVGREVLIKFPVGTLGDTLGWFPYAVKFLDDHGCKLTCCMAEKLIQLFADAYPEIRFVGPKDVDPARFYATYNLGLFFDDKAKIHQPCDFRQVGLHRTAGYILGVDPTEVPPKIALAESSRPIADPYVVIAAQSTTQAKYWNNPTGWRTVIQFLKAAGYRVICVDQKPVHGTGLMWNHIPHGVEDQTGISLQECARWMTHADFFIGLSSGLSWLAWAAGPPVVLISGFSHPVTEFTTPYRIINYHACNSCWDDPALRFDHKDFMWCPRHKDTPRQFECTRLITAAHVTRVISRIPQYRRRMEEMAPTGKVSSVGP